MWPLSVLSSVKQRTTLLAAYPQARFTLGHSPINHHYTTIPRINMAFVTDDKLDLLFDPKLIPESVHKLVGSDLHIRPLALSDYERGHLKVMQVLTSTPDPGKEAYQEAFKRMQNASPSSYFILSIIDKSKDQILAIGSVFLEYKFIRNLGICGHIEDIAVDANAQGKGLGKKLILALTELSESLGSYKVILDCSEENKGFYEKCGYKYKGAQMAKYKE